MRRKVTYATPHMLFSSNLGHLFFAKGCELCLKKKLFLETLSTPRESNQLISKLHNAHRNTLVQNAAEKMVK